MASPTPDTGPTTEKPADKPAEKTRAEEKAEENFDPYTTEGTAEYDHATPPPEATPTSKSKPASDTPAESGGKEG